MTKKTLVGTGLALALFVAPLLASATTVTGGSNNSGGFLGVSGGNSSFFFSWGTGANAALCTTSICGVAVTIITLINNILVPLLFAVAFIMFLYGVARKYIFSHGDETAVGEGHRLILWGLIGFVVMISLWGLVNVVATTFGLTGTSAPPYPSSVPDPI